MSDFRKCAGIVVFNAEGKVLVCARADKRTDQWQFPQGGILKKETPAEAGLRELREETSLTSVELVKTLDKPLRYEFPPAIRRAMQKRGIQTFGQEMYWSLFRLTGSENEINLQTATPEFKAWQWVPIAQAVAEIVYFKKDVYRAMAEIFAPLLPSVD